MESERQQLLIQDQHPVSRRWAVFEDDGVSAWLYLSEPGVMRPVADCWVYNRIPAPPASEIEQYQGGPPPACAGYAGPDAQYPGIEPPQASVLWSEDGESVAIMVGDTVLGFIVAGSKRGFSRHLLNLGPWGSPWDEQRYQEIFGATDAGTSLPPPNSA
jgi:hypothetical protein